MNTRILQIRRAARTHKNSAFTLVELLVVIVIIGLLATAVVMNYDKIIPQAKKTVVASDLHMLEQAVDFYKYQNGGKLPESLERLVEKDPQGIAYLKNRSTVPRDPWGHEYFYQPHSNGMSFELLSYGSDGAQGGEGEAEDISLESINEKKDKR